jgi:CubicO group peptidase (beta-lactamase class C family)
LRQLATDWAKTDKEPFVLALARHGVLFLHEAFGKLDGKPLPLAHRFRPASIGKNFAALVFAQFMERGWLKPRQTVGEVLVSWPRTGPKAVTFRQLFDHTAGLHGHTTYAGLDNPWLEEAFAAHVLPSVEVGLRYEYEGDGGNIAAKAMELIDGRAFPILQREVLFGPLGANSIDQWDCGWAAAATTLDMAKVAQMLLQKGAYGDWQFFGEKTWEALLPVPLSSLYPTLRGSDHERGIGLEHGWDPEDDAASAKESPGGRPPKKLHTVGHGSASSSIYRVDYRHDIVMVAGRISAPDGQAYEKYLHEIVRTLDAAVMD